MVHASASVGVARVPLSFYHYKRMLETLWVPRDCTVTLDFYSHLHYEITVRKTLGDGQILKSAESVTNRQLDVPNKILDTVAMLLQFIAADEFKLKNGDRRWEWLYQLEPE